MLTVLLECLLWYAAFLRPLVVGMQLCRHAREGKLVNATLITNVTLAMVILWMLNVADALLLSHLFSMSKLYMCLRILASLYLLHPASHGASKEYNRLFAVILRTHGPFVYEFVERHLTELNRIGVVKYLGSMIASMLTLASALLGFAKQSTVALTDREYPPANIERRVSSPEED